MSEWQPISTAPKDKLIVGWCSHDADAYFIDDKRLTLYGAHVEGLSHAHDGPNVIEWGGAWDDRTHEDEGAGHLGDWWFVYGSNFECAANPTHWIPLPEPAA